MNVIKLKIPICNHKNEHCHYCGNSPFYMLSSVVHEGERVYFCNKNCELQSGLTKIKGVTSHDW